MDYETFKSYLIKYLDKYDIKISEKTRDDDFTRLYEYMKYILAVNKNINLTAIKDETEFIKKHIIDSLYILKYIDKYLEKDAKKTSYLDIGTGGGFPLIPIHIVKKYYSYGLDSTLKKLKVIKEKEDINIIHGRAEILAHDYNYREKFNLVTTRAVSNLKNVIEYSAGFVCIGGIAILMRGKKEEITEEIKNTIAENSFKLLLHDEYLLFDDSRSVVILKKIKHTPKHLPNKNSKHYKK